MARRPLGARIAQALARWLRNTADVLDAPAEGAEPPGPERPEGVPAHWAARLAQGRPPAHWLEHIRQRAPHLLSGQGWQVGATPERDRGPVPVHSNDVSAERASPPPAALRPAAPSPVDAQPASPRPAAQRGTSAEVDSRSPTVPPPPRVPGVSVYFPAKASAGAGKARRPSQAAPTVQPAQPEGPDSRAQGLAPAAEAPPRLTRERTVRSEPEPSESISAEAHPARTWPVEPEGPGQATDAAGRPARPLPRERAPDPWAGLVWGEQIRRPELEPEGDPGALLHRSPASRSESTARAVPAKESKAEGVPPLGARARPTHPGRASPWPQVAPALPAHRGIRRGAAEEARAESSPARSAPGPFPALAPEDQEPLGRRAASNEDEALSETVYRGEDHWPERPDPEVPAEGDQDEREAFRAWQRQHRLNKEQRGDLWNE